MGVEGGRAMGRGTAGPWAVALRLAEDLLGVGAGGAFVAGFVDCCDVIGVALAGEGGEIAEGRACDRDWGEAGGGWGELV